MESASVGILEFREHLAKYLLKRQAQVAITNHGDTIGGNSR